MSEEMILSGAFFDNSMPKWATEETMKRIGNDLKKDNTQTRKQHDKMIMLLGKIVQNSNKEEKSQRETLKEIKSIAREIKESNKTNKELVKEVKKSNKLADEANKQAKKNTTTTNQKDEKIDTSTIEGHILDTNNVLERIHRLMQKTSVDMSRNLESRNNILGRSNFKPAKPQDNEIVREPSYALDDIMQGISDKFNDSRGYGGRRGAGITNEIASTKGPVRRFNGRIMTMIAAIGGFVGKIKKFGAAILDFIKRIPLVGTKIAAAIGAMSAALDLANMISENFDEYRNLVNRGISFARTNVEQTRMDGIRVRKMIGEVGITFEAAMKSMEGSVALINDIGIKGYMNTIKDVMGTASDATSFVNQVMMAQSEIGEFAGEYLRSLKLMGDYERLNSRERYEGIQLFIKSSRMFAQMTGRSIDELKGILGDLASDSNVSTYLGGIQDEDQRDQAKMSLSLMSATFGKESPFYKMLVDAVTDPTGAGLYQTDANAPLQIIGGAIGEDLIGQLQNIVKGVGTNTAEENALLMAELKKSFEESYARMDEGSRKMLLNQLKLSGNASVRDVLDALRGGLTRFSDVGKTMAIAEQGGDVSKTATEEAKAAQMARATKESAEAAIEYATASLADSDASRATMRTGYELMIQTNNITEKGARAAVSSAHTLMENLPSITGKIDDIIAIMTGEDTNKEKGEEALKSKDLGLVAKQQREEISKLLNASGIDTSGDNRGGTREEMAKRYQERKKKMEEYLESNNMDLETLMEQAKSDNATVSDVAKDLMMYLSSNQMQGMLTNSQRAEYGRGLEEVLSEMSEAKRKQYEDTIAQKLRSGIPAMYFQGKVNHEQEKIREATKKQMEENDSEVRSSSSEAASDAARQAEEAENERRAQRDKMKSQTNSANLTFNEDGLSNAIARPNGNVDSPENNVNVINLVNDTFNNLNSTLENIYGVLKINGEESNSLFRDIRENTRGNGGSVNS